MIPQSKIRLDTKGLIAAGKAVVPALDSYVGLAMQFAADVVARRAKESTLFKDGTGALRNSIHGEPPRGSFSRGGVRVDTLAGGKGRRVLNYAPHVEWGTKAHNIFPRRKRALRWGVKSGWVFRRAVHHPGTKARPFMRTALRDAMPMIEREIGAAVRTAYKRAGFSV